MIQGEGRPRGAEEEINNEGALLVGCAPSGRGKLSRQSAVKISQGCSNAEGQSRLRGIYSTVSRKDNRRDSLRRFRGGSRPPERVIFDVCLAF